MMRAALFLCSSDELNSYREYIQLWTIAARAGWGIAGVFTDDGLDELRRMIARRAVDVVLVWSADHLSRELQNELRATPCGLYSHQPAAQPPAAESECSTLAGIAREGKRGRPRIHSATEQAIRSALAEGKGIRKVAKECGVGVSVVQRVKASAG